MLNLLLPLISAVLLVTFAVEGNIYYLLVGLLLLVLWPVLLYNSLIIVRNRTKEAWSDIDVQLKRRYDLIPNLVKTVQGYAKHESGVFEKVTQTRAQAMQGQDIDPKKQAENENMLSGALKSLFAVSENYPDLKANTNFLELQRELSDTENKIQSARRFFNSTVLDYNNKIQVFPDNVLAGMMRMVKKDFFELEDEKEKEPVQVSF